MEKFNLLGIHVAIGTYESLVKNFLNSSPITYSCVNQYYLNLSYEDSNYRDLINQFDIVHLDGIGANLAIKVLSNYKLFPPRITGTDLYFKILEGVEKSGLSIYFFGDSGNVLSRALNAIRKKFPSINILGSHHGYVDINDENVGNEIEQLGPDVLFVGLGAKRQEFWINKWRPRLKNSRIIAVGGGLRVFAKDRARGNNIIQKMGFEWLVRLFSEPKMLWKRYLIGIPLFIFRIIKERLKEK